MAYDEELAHRIRELLADRDDVTEQPMFGGLAFLLSGHLAVAASGRGGLLCRVDPSTAGRLTSSTGAQRMVMGGRTMAGWLLVPPDDLRTRRQLAAWVRRGASFVASLPPKTAGRGRR